MNNDYINLVEFWNKSFQLSIEDKKEILNSIKDDDYQELAPSIKLFNALLNFKECNNVLDYGCGSGWASIILSKIGTKKITAVDVSINSIEMVNCYKKAFRVEDKIESFVIDEAFLEKETKQYDGFFCSNVIDVIPLKMAEKIIEASSKIVKDGSTVIYSLNYYIDPIIMEQRGFKVEDKKIYIDGILRLNSLKDEEWEELFKKYFKEISLEFFLWPGEEKETRRLFILKK